MRKALYLLADLDDADLAWFAEVGSVRTLDAGEVLIRAGEVIASTSIVLDGHLRVVGADGGEIAPLATGDIVGEMSLIQRRPPTVSVVAGASARVLDVANERLRTRLAADDAFAARFYRALTVFLADRLRATTDQLGYGAVTAPTDPSKVGDELDDEVLDHVHVAGDRMKRLVELVDGR